MQEQVQPLKEDITADDITIKEATIKDGDDNVIKTEPYAAVSQTIEVKITADQARRAIDQLNQAKQQALANIEVYDKQIAANQVVLDSLTPVENPTKAASK